MPEVAAIGPMAVRVDQTAPPREISPARIFHTGKGNPQNTSSLERAQSCFLFFNSVSRDRRRLP
jgi:hypothetical protein